jgi:HSP20 family protein
MTLVKFNPEKRNGSQLPSINDVFDTIFSDTFFSNNRFANVPAVNVCESADYYHIELAAPGLEKEDFKIALERRMLNISVEKENNEQQAERDFSRKEYSYHSFVRSFTLPDSADDARIEASYINGILKIDIAKKDEAKIVQRQIEIK